MFQFCQFSAWVFFYHLLMSISFRVKVVAHSTAACFRFSDNVNDTWRLSEKHAKIWALDLGKGGGGEKKEGLYLETVLKRF